MKRIIIKQRTYPEFSEAWLQTRFLWTWWTSQVKIGSFDEVIDWAIDKNCNIIDITDNY